MDNEIRRFETISELFAYYAGLNVDSISLDLRTGMLTIRVGRRINEALVHGGRFVSRQIQLPMIRNVAQRRVLLNLDLDAFIDLLTRSGIAFLKYTFRIRLLDFYDSQEHLILSHNYELPDSV
ncbi:hypothetical protein [uncultured Secundilactobacillus sp.]|uniref:hypothetical protein n=1 Tax=uncultured Secundilactobacillus sp. TaxID=2813935 RepID=UPI00258C41CD|nr:hypothetical protein [uncultured Secundilactobacillus sp.]